MSLLEYKGYQGTIEIEDNILFGHVLGLKNTIISYEGNNINEFSKWNRENCQINGEEPENDNI